ncbi:GOLPH3/VPS74 family protein [Parafrankia discariae]|uniref:GOLPH3/VPS74 family protein n=1 Tax=Parafrankia discariae TaxID=365528 RepID=UPI000370FD04|nr:GPP34 family phosphoprotein [Parafrankia discariae]
MDLTTAEKFVLLTLDESGGDRAGVGVDVALAAALVADLAIAGDVRFDAGTLALSPGGTPATDNALLSGTYEVVVAATEPASATVTADLLQRFAGDLAPLREKVAGLLVEKDVLAVTKHRTAGILQVLRYPVTDPAPGRALHAALESALFAADAPSPGDAVLLALLRPFGLLDQLVPERRRAEANGRADAVIGSAALPRALNDAVSTARTTLLAALAASSAGAAAASG